jgi:RES domain-containing protein
MGGLKLLSIEEIDELKEKRLCHNCVGENYLSDEILKLGQSDICSYCWETAESYRLGDLSDRIESVFKQHFYRTSNEPKAWEYAMLADTELGYEWDREGQQVLYAIANAAEIPKEAASDIQQILEERHSDYEAAKMGEETEFASESYYSEKGADDREWQEVWRQFEHSLKTEARFFSSEAIKHLESIFAGIEQMQTSRGRPLIIDAGPGTSLTELYRARVFQKDGVLKDALKRPDLHLGSPPPEYALSGRMNAFGISVFYGANNPNVALSEVRPPVGSQVMVARFEITKSIRLLDLTALESVREIGSLFDPTYINRLDRAKFLRTLSQRITKPVMPNDEPFDYLSTQAIADFLSTNRSIQIDGIIYPSVQVANASLNIVLFHKAARVEKIEIPNGTKINVRLWEQDDAEWYPDFTVYEEVPKKNIEKGVQKKTIPFDFIDDLIDIDPDSRLPTLKIDLESLRVHIIESVQFNSDEYHVSRHRWEKDIDPDF